MAGYLMVFGLGGFLKYGRSVSSCVGEEELKMYEGCRKKKYDSCGEMQECRK
jgi:hypothetical protein